MCNAWNHPPGCNCGWGGSGRGNGGGIYASLFSSVTKTTSDENDDEKSETYPTQCWWCGAFVSYHTNGYGDSVLFDSLGYPWEIHSCWEKYWKEEKDRRRVINYFSNEQNRAQQKRTIIMGAVRKLKGVTFGSFGFYGATEEAVARQLGISVSQLRQSYSDIYKVDSAGILFIYKLEKINSYQIVKINKNKDLIDNLADHTETITFKLDRLMTNYNKWDKWLQKEGFQVLKIRSKDGSVRKIKAFFRKSFKYIDYRIEIDLYDAFNYYAKIKVTALAEKKSEAKDMVEGLFKKIENLTKFGE